MDGEPEMRRRYSRAAVKWIAFLSMFADHFSKILGWPISSRWGIDVRCISILGFRWSWLEDLGRMAFPLFAFGIAEGSRRTRNPWRYLLRLLAAAVITQPIYELALARGGNVLFTLAGGLFFIAVFDRWIQPMQPRPLKGLCAAALFAAVYFALLLFQCDYWPVGLPLILSFRYLPTERAKKTGAFVLLSVFYLFYATWNGAGFMLFDPHLTVRLHYVLPWLFAVLSLHFVSDDPPSGRLAGGRWMYLIYPMHLAMFYGVGLLLAS